MFNIGATLSLIAICEKWFTMCARNAQPSEWKQIIIINACLLCICRNKERLLYIFYNVYNIIALYQRRTQAHDPTCEKARNDIDQIVCASINWLLTWQMTNERDSKAKRMWCGGNANNNNNNTHINLTLATIARNKQMPFCVYLCQAIQIRAHNVELFESTRL